MPTRFVDGTAGCVLIAVKWTSAARLFRAVVKSWLLHASIWAWAMATAGESGSADTAPCLSGTGLAVDGLRYAMAIPANGSSATPAPTFCKNARRLSGPTDPISAAHLSRDPGAVGVL